MRYYKSECGKLIQFNTETKVYKVRNTVSTDDKRISIDNFKELKTVEIKRDKFSQLMNEYFKSIKHEWIHDDVKYRKLDNFEKEGYKLSSNYIIGKDIPFHDIGPYMKNVILVYHWGKVYYHTVSYNGYESGQLIDVYTKNIVRWAQLKNCSPVFDTVKKKIV